MDYWFVWFQMCGRIEILHSSRLFQNSPTFKTFSSRIPCVILLPWVRRKRSNRRKRTTTEWGLFHMELVWIDWDRIKHRYFIEIKNDWTVLSHRVDISQSRVHCWSRLVRAGFHWNINGFLALLVRETITEIRQI